MKKFLYMAVAAIAALSSCTSDDIVSGEKGNNANAPVFTATIEGDATSRTQLVEGSTAGKLTKVNWESGDEVKMLFVNSSYSVITLPVYQVTPSTVDASTATLTIKDGETYNEAADLLFVAIYPASLMTDQMKYIFPATQEYKGDGKIGFAPMLGVKESQSVPQTLNFKNACALLAITIPYTEMTSVHSITVSSDLQMNGQMNLDTGGFFNFNSPSNPGSGENQVTLDCYSLNNANVAIPEGGSKTFYVSIVPKDDVEQAPYLKYLQIDVTDGNITKTMRTKTFEGTKTSGIEIVKNKIYPITFAENYTPTSKLNIKVTSDDIAKVKKIKVVTDKNIVGESKEKVLDIPAAQQTPSADGTVYSIEIPSQTYAFYQIYLSADGTTYKEAMATKKAAGLGTLARNTIYDIDYQKNAEQLWANGPYFATENVGIWDNNSGTQYPWGNNGDGYYTDTNYEKDASGNYIIPAAYDVATYEWGYAWRMPTKDEFSVLTDEDRNKSYKDTEPYGFTIEGDNGYSSIFFPVDKGGESCEYYGKVCCWSATPYDEQRAYYLFLEWTGESLHFQIRPEEEEEDGNAVRYERRFVRAVLR